MRGDVTIAELRSTLHWRHLDERQRLSDERQAEEVEALISGSDDWMRSMLVTESSTSGWRISTIRRPWKAEPLTGKQLPLVDPLVRKLKDE